MIFYPFINLTTEAKIWAVGKGKKVKKIKVPLLSLHNNQAVALFYGRKETQFI